MSKILKDLFEKRDALLNAFETEAGTYRSIDAPTAEQTASYEARKGALVKLDERILEVRDDEARQEKIDAARKEAGILLPGDGVVRSEPKVYGPGTRHSYYLDLAISAMPGDQRYLEAQERMNAYGRQVVRDAVNDPEVRGRAVRMAKQHYRKNEARAREFVGQLETRAMDTTAASGGSFVTPDYLVSQYAPYRQFGRVFIDQANKQDLPEYGMTVYLPKVDGPSSVANQGGDGLAVTETDPTAGYISANLETQAGQVKLSQQLIDRAGPGIEFDKIVFDSLQRNYNQTIDAWALTQALASANIVADASVGATGISVIQDFYSDIAQATQTMETTEGTVLSPTHLFVSGPQWSFISSQLDGEGRPLIVPSAGVPYNAIAAAISGKTEVVTEGRTNYEVQDIPVFKDNNIPTIAATPVETQLVVAHMPEVWIWEGDLVPRTIPQTYAGNLQILLQVYTYVAALVRYPYAVQSVQGARYPAAPVFTRS